MLIRCPECNNEVSDKAEICPHCGIKIAGNPEVTGTLTGTGIAIKPAPTQPKRVEAGKGKSKAVWVVSLIIALAVFGVGFYFYQSAQQDKEQEAFEYALHSNDLMVMQNYLSKYQDAPREHRDSINAVIDMMKYEDLEWNNAVNSGSKNELLKYIEENQNSPHITEAKNKIDSIDYSHAMREYKSSKNVLALQKYLTEHPNGRYSSQVQDIMDELKSVEVTPEEMEMAKGVCRKFLQAINSRNEAKLLSTVTEILDSFLNRTGATNQDVVTFMNKLYKDDITNMNWYMMDDFKAEKVDNVNGNENVNGNYNGNKNIRVQFGAEQRMERTNPNKEKIAKYIIVADVTPEGLITRFNMKKVAIAKD